MADRKSREMKLIPKFSRIILKLRHFWIALTIVLTLFFGYQASKIQYEFSLETLFITDSPLQNTLQEFQDYFGKDDNLFIVAHGAEDLFSPTGYDRIKTITSSLEKIIYFDHVITLTSSKTIQAAPGGFELVPVLDVDDPENADWAAIKANLLADPLVVDALISKDGYATSFSMEIPDKFNNNVDRAKAIREVKEVFAPFLTTGEYHFTGIPYMRNTFIDYMKHDNLIFVPLCTLIVSLLAFWLFRAIKANIFSLIMITATMIWTVGAMALGGATLNIITVVMPSLLMVMGMAYVTHFLSRYIEETANDLEKEQALFTTLKAMMLPIGLTSFTTGVGFLSLLVIKIDLVRQFGAFSALGLGFAFFLTMTFLSALCLYFKPFNPKKAIFSENDLFGRYLKWNDRFVKTHPWKVIFISLALLIFTIFFITRVQVDSRIMDESNPNSPEYAAHDFMVKHLAGIIPLEIMVKAKDRDAFKEPANLQALEQLEEFTRETPGINYSLSLVSIIKKMNQAMHDGDPAYYTIPPTREAVTQYLLLYDGDQLERLVTGGFDRARIAFRCADIGSKKIQAVEITTLAKGKELFSDDFEVIVTGSSLLTGKVNDQLIVDMVKSLFLAAMVIIVLMVFLFRSLRLGVLAMIPNLIPILMTMGFLGLIGLNLRTSIVVVFSISLGIAVDDTIHFITRCRNEFKKDQDYDRALKRTFLGTGRPIIFTSILLFLGFGVLATSSFVPTKNFGMLSAVTMLTALLGDLFLLPSLLWVFKPKLK